MTVFAKDPAATLDYSFDWSAWLAPGETITTDSWAVEPAGVGAPMLGVETVTGATRAVLVSGGTAGHRYRLSCHIETDAGRTAERSATLRVMEV